MEGFDGFLSPASGSTICDNAPAAAAATGAVIRGRAGSAPCADGVARAPRGRACAAIRGARARRSRHDPSALPA